MILNTTTTTNTTSESKQPIIERITPLPSVLIDFMAMTLCDLIPSKKTYPLPIMPELVYFIQKITFQAGINCRTALVALIYLNRAKKLLPKGSVGGHDTCHRMFLASIILASKFLSEDVNMIITTTRIPSTWSHYYSFYHYNNLLIGPLTNQKLSDICGIFPLHEINQLERAFLKLIEYRCWVDEIDLQNFVLAHRVDFSL